MPIKSLKGLPPSAKAMWESVYKKSKDKYGEERAAKIAWTIVKQNYKNVRAGKKSVAVEQGNFESGTDKISGTFIDVLLGYPTVDEHGEYLADSFWSKKPMGVLKGDMEHYYADKAEGLKTEENPDYDGWVPIAQKFWHGNNNELYARVELPENHPFTPTFLTDWESGKYGLSIEFMYPDEAVEYVWDDNVLRKKIIEGALTGFTFTENPAITGTKNGNR